MAAHCCCSADQIMSKQLPDRSSASAATVIFSKIIRYLKEQQTHFQQVLF
jgi:hypothetical protein